MLLDSRNSFERVDSTLPASAVGRRIAMLVLLGLLVYLPAFRGPFFWDDEEQVSQNPDVIQPFGILNTWLNTQASEYVPLTTTSYWFEWGWWHGATTGYHIDNVLLHGLNAGLLWLVLRRLRVGGSFIGSLLFLLHPVCVESVAWIAERRNVLTLMFGLLATLAYLQAEETGSRRSYYGALILFCAALLSKATIVMLPPVLLLSAWWLRGRFTLADLRRVTPFFALSLAAALVRIWFERRRAMGSIDLRDFTLARRAETATEAVWFYVGKVLYPFNLTLIYPRFSGSLGFAVMACIGIAGAVIILALVQKSWARPFVFAAAYFALMLVPALGLFDIAYMQHANVADHFQYLALIGPVALIGAGAARWPRLGLPVGTVICVVFVGLTASRAWYFGHPDELWRLTIKQNPAAWTAHEHLGIALYEKSEISAAAQEFERSVALRPQNFRAWFNLGTMLHLESRYDDAIAAYTRALDLRPDLVVARSRIEACRQKKTLIIQSRR